MKQDNPRVKLFTPGTDQTGDRLWQKLSQHALEPNPFFSSSFITAFNAHKAGGSLQVLLALDPSGTKALAALPITKLRKGLLFRLPSALAGDYGPLGTLLMAEEASENILNDLLEAASALSTTGAVYLPFHGTSGPVYKRLHNTLASYGWAQHITTADRAFQRAGSDGQADFETLKTRSSWKEAARKQRRLEKRGTLSFSMLKEPNSITIGLEEFLQLEAAGWKGKQGSALLSRQPDADFTRELILKMGENDGVRIGQLKLDDKLIATNVLLREQGHIFGWKTAFDESLSKFSPGQILINQTTQELLRDPEFTGADSLSTPNNQMANKAWPSRFPYATLLIGKGPLARFAMWEAEAGAHAKQAAKNKIKKLLGRK